MIRAGRGSPHRRGRGAPASAVGTRGPGSFPARPEQAGEAVTCSERTRLASPGTSTKMTGIRSANAGVVISRNARRWRGRRTASHANGGRSASEILVKPDKCEAPNACSTSERSHSKVRLGDYTERMAPSIRTLATSRGGSLNLRSMRRHRASCARGPCARGNPHGNTGQTSPRHRVRHSMDGAIVLRRMRTHHAHLVLRPRYGQGCHGSREGDRRAHDEARRRSGAGLRLGQERL